MTLSENDIERNGSQDEKHNRPQPNMIEIPAVVDGEIIPIDQVDDQIFSQKLIGEGYGIRPTGKTVYSPVDGKVEQIAASKYVVYLEFNNGLKLLIHIGIDTIELEGKGFETNLRKGMSVNKGDSLITFDPQFIADEGFDPVVSVVLLNGPEIDFDVIVNPEKEAKASETIAMKITVK